jgi:hypothetical protein
MREARSLWFGDSASANWAASAQQRGEAKDIEHHQDDADYEAVVNSRHRYAEWRSNFNSISPIDEAGSEDLQQAASSMPSTRLRRQQLTHY